MRYSKIVNRHKGTVEAFLEDSSVAADNTVQTVANMVASVVSGSSVSIPTQTYSSAREELTFTVNFSSVGTSTIKVLTTFSGSDETIVSIYLFRTLDDGTGVTDYA